MLKIYRLGSLTDGSFLVDGPTSSGKPECLEVVAVLKVVAVSVSTFTFFVSLTRRQRPCMTMMATMSSRQRRNSYLHYI
jgi:hypothetical protein